MKRRKERITTSPLEGLSKNKVVAGRVAWILAVYFIHLPPVKEPVSDCFRDGLRVHQDVNVRLGTTV